MALFPSGRSARQQVADDHAIAADINRVAAALGSLRAEGYRVSWPRFLSPGHVLFTAVAR
jgi:hypothetical protein